MRKMRFLVLLLVGVLAQAADAPTILIFGDSLSAGHGINMDQSWTNLLQARLRAQGYEHRVVNASISGETTDGGVTRIMEAIARFKPVLVVVELGGNDGLRGFPSQRIEENLDKIVRTVKASGAAVVLLGMRIPPNYGPRYTESFHAVYGEVAKREKIPLVDFFMQGVALDRTLMQDDGIHPNAAGQPILLDNAWPIIRKALDKQGG